MIINELFDCLILRCCFGHLSFMLPSPWYQVLEKERKLLMAAVREEGGEYKYKERKKTSRSRERGGKEKTSTEGGGGDKEKS